MARKKKNFWYVLVLTETGPTFVTKVEHQPKIAHWDKDEKPLELGQYTAEDLTLGLNLNFNVAYAVKLPFPLETQPYLYNKGHFEWVEGKLEDGEKETKDE